MKLLFSVACAASLLLASNNAASSGRTISAAFTHMQKLPAVNKVVTAAGDIKTRWARKAATLATAAILVCGFSSCDKAEDPVRENDISITVEDMVGEMLLVGFHGEQIDYTAHQMFTDIQPGGVILFDSGEMRNIVSPEQTKWLTTTISGILGDDVLIAVDAEGGYVNRLKTKHGFTVDVPSAQALGEGTPEATRAISVRLAQQMRSVGINLNLAPVVDINVNPTSPAIGKWERSFSADPEVVVAQARAFIAGHREQRVLTTLKHFPGHGSATGDTHIGITDITSTYQREAELYPYKTLIQEGYSWPVMLAHVIDRNVGDAPATLSHAVVTVLLRHELGFTGVIISDDMQMGAIVQEYQLENAVVTAVQAGVDIILLANKFPVNDNYSDDVYQVRDAIMQAVKDGVISEASLEASWVRIQELKGQM